MGAPQLERSLAPPRDLTRRARHPLHCRLAAPRPPRPASSSIALSARLADADTDKDGTINEGELHAALRRLTRDVTTEAAAAALIRRLDSDHDGEVSVAQLERFLDAYASRLARAETVAREQEELNATAGTGSAARS